jgi:uncharacterized protein YqjF (DUF2071 family)
MKSTFLTAEWNNLIMANYKIDPAILLPYVPSKTELDFFKGETYISLIGFMFEEVRLKGFKIPFHTNFEEVNLRFYVKYFDNGEWKRGAVFIKEIVPKPMISFVANTLYHEKYSTKSMNHFYNNTEDEIHLGYHWKHKGKWSKIEATTSTKLLPMQNGSEEEFIAEHYFGYSKYNDATTYEYTVQHPSWKIYYVKNYLIDCDFKAMYGNEFSFLQNKTPDSIFVAKGSPISILGKRKL